MLFFAEPISSTQQEVTVPPIGPDELPPPYTATPQGGLPMINCKLCQAMINIEGKTHLHVVKCSVCHEATVSIHITFTIIKTVLELLWGIICRT